MTDENARSDRNRTDEPDGTTAYAASLRPPGESVTTAPNGGDDLGPDQDDLDAVPVDSHSGYDPEAVSGDSAEYRPQ